MKNVDFDFDGEIVRVEMVKPDKKPKSYVEARCGGRRGEPHIMVLAQLSRGWSCDGGCGTGRRDWAGHDYYTC